MIQNLCLPANEIEVMCKTDSDEGSFFDDPNETCMKSCIISYKIIREHFITPMRIEFKLRDLNAINLKVSCEDGTFKLNPENKDFYMAALAVDSILKHLYLSGCTSKHQFSFQARRGSIYDTDSWVSDISSINILPKEFKHDDILTTINQFENDTISRTYAYLSQNRLCIFLNDLSDSQLEKISTVLNPLFPQSS